MHVPPVRASGVGSFLFSRGVRILLLIFVFFAVVSWVPLPAAEQGGQNWKLSHYVYTPEPVTPLGYTEEGWRKGYGKHHPPQSGEGLEGLSEEELEEKLGDGEQGDGYLDEEEEDEEQAEKQLADMGRETTTQKHKSQTTRKSPTTTTPVREDKMVASKTLGHLEKETKVALSKTTEHSSNEVTAASSNTPGHPAKENKAVLPKKPAPTPGIKVHQDHTEESHGPQSPYAYVFYATEDAYACGVLINVDRLQKRFKTKYRIFVLATRDLSKPYMDAFEARNVTVSIQRAPPMPESSSGYYVNCMVKLLAFKMHQIDASLRRVLTLDSDQLILQNLDHLFTELPAGVDLATPNAYWQGDPTALSSTFMMITPSDRLWRLVEPAIREVKPDRYDMDIVNDLFAGKAMALPGNYVTINSHWEAWDLPKWWHEEDDDEDGSLVHDGEDEGSGVERLGKRPVGGEKAGRAGQGHRDSSSDDASGHYRRRTPEVKTKGKAVAVDEEEEEEMEEEEGWGGVVAAGGPPKPVNRRPVQPAVGEAKAASSNKAKQPVMEEVDDDADEDTTATHKAAVTTEKGVSPPPPSEENKADKELYTELIRLYSDVAVLHFFAMGKPWSYSLQAVQQSRPDAHPLFYQQFKEWREQALATCPPGLVAFV